MPPRAISSTAASSWRLPTVRTASSCGSGRWRTAAPRKSARRSAFPTWAARWRPSPTNWRWWKARRTATTCRFASALPLLLPDLLANPLQGPAQDAGDVHLGMADLLGDLGLSHVVDEAQAQDQPLALVEVG